MSNPVIGYTNHFETGTVSASSEATDFEVEKAFDWFTYDYWKPTGFSSEHMTVDMGSATAADYWAVFAHDAHTQGSSLQLRGSTDNFSSSDVLVDSATPTTSSVIMRSFSSVSYRYWRLLISGGSAATSIGVAMVGPRLDMLDGMQVGFIPPTMSYSDKVLNNQSHGGQFLGRSVIREGARGTMRFTLMTPAWIRSDWMPFLDHARIKPFVLSWDETNYPAEAAYCWTEKSITPPRYSHTTYQLAELSYVGLVE